MHLESRYVRPARYDELLTIETTLRKLPLKDIVFHTEIKNEAGKIVNGGRVKLCFIDKMTGNAVFSPDILIHILKPFFK
ncbi:MAG: acyl-CoA thioesterase, partial [Bacteroidota bacterium]